MARGVAGVLLGERADASRAAPVAERTWHLERVAHAASLTGQVL